jgi:hypothetical protein
MKIIRYSSKYSFLFTILGIIMGLNFYRMAHWGGAGSTSGMVWYWIGVCLTILFCLASGAFTHLKMKKSQSGIEFNLLIFNNMICGIVIFWTAFQVIAGLSGM